MRFAVGVVVLQRILRCLTISFALDVICSKVLSSAAFSGVNLSLTAVEFLTILSGNKKCVITQIKNELNDV